MNDSGQRLAWITGAGKGIGRALAKRLAHDGWIVAVSARTESDLASLETEGPPGRINAFPLDVTNKEKTEETVAAIENQMGALDLVVLNAGTHVPMTADTFSTDVFQRLVDVNLIGVANGLAHVMPRFIARRSGHIAVVGSLAGYRGLPTSAAYGATKAGVINMCEALMPELERHDVRLSLINPGFVETPLTDKNDFPMPFLISAESAADRIARGLRKTAFQTAFPRRFSFLMKLLRILPDRLFFLITRRMVGK